VGHLELVEFVIAKKGKKIGNAYNPPFKINSYLTQVAFNIYDKLMVFKIDKT